MISQQLPKLFRIKSYVRRDARRTPGQDRAYKALWPQFGLPLENGQLNLPQLFGRQAPCLLEIGFGSGQSLLACAEAYPECDFIGVETHKPGIGALLLGVERRQLTNIRVFNADVIDVLERCIPNNCLDGIQIFFPDPWPKRRHHPRRLIQSEFVRSVVTKLKQGGSLHLATDWEDYAQHMLQVLSAEQSLMNQTGPNEFADRSKYRPTITKFEQRAVRQGRGVWELDFHAILP